MHPPFVDREEELSQLLELSEKGFYPVLYIYGPEGCGKTRLLRELYHTLHKRSGFLVAYIDATESTRLEDAVASTPELLKPLLEMAGDLVGPPGKVLAALLPAALKRLQHHLVRGKHVVILVDDVARPMGLDNIEYYAKKLADAVDELYGKGAESVLVLATTSEGLSRRLLARHNYVMLAQIWNLSREAHDKLLKVLKAPEHVAEDSWQTTGGNPRTMITLSRLGWDTSKLVAWISRSIRTVLGDTLSKHRRELEEALEDPDTLTGHPQLAEKLLQNNLVTPVDRPCLGYTPPVDRELGIGRYYAWQTPAHRKALRQLLQQRP